MEFGLNLLKKLGSTQQKKKKLIANLLPANFSVLITVHTKKSSVQACHASRIYLQAGTDLTKSDHIVLCSFNSN